MELKLLTLQNLSVEQMAENGAHMKNDENVAEGRATAFRREVLLMHAGHFADQYLRIHVCSNDVMPRCYDALAQHVLMPWLGPCQCPGKQQTQQQARP